MCCRRVQALQGMERIVACAAALHTGTAPALVRMQRRMLLAGLAASLVKQALSWAAGKVQALRSAVLINKLTLLYANTTALIAMLENLQAV